MPSPEKSPKSMKIKDGVFYYPGLLKHAEQASILDEIEGILREAPYFTPRMPRTGKPFSVKMSNCGPLGWVSDQKLGYRYEGSHPVTARPWPNIPVSLIGLWTTLTGFEAPPEACLINYYDGSARMGLHLDNDEQEPRAPILSISLGDDAWFRIGGLKRKDPTERVRLKSGDILCMTGPARFIYHGIDRVIAGTSSLLPEGGRLNLTLRRVTPVPPKEKGQDQK